MSIFAGTGEALRFYSGCGQVYTRRVDRGVAITSDGNVVHNAMQSSALTRRRVGGVRVDVELVLHSRLMQSKSYQVRIPLSEFS
jgi:hypothetical protein